MRNDDAVVKVKTQTKMLLQVDYDAHLQCERRAQHRQVAIADTYAVHRGVV
jgi:hypothetical protein